MTFFSKHRCFFLLYPFHIAALSVVLVPFVRFNNLLEWDFPGHYAAIWHLKEHLLPWPAGWNPYFYAGYPQGTFYPPLAHYVAALLSYPLGIEWAMKALVCLSILSIPLAFYVFSRKWGLDGFHASICATWMTALLFLCGEMFGTVNFGSDLKSILNVGLFANALSLPLLFFFMAFCGGDSPLSRWKPAALLLGILILTHPLSALIAGIFWLSISISRILPDCRSHSWSPIFKTLGVGILLSALWALPFIARRGYMNPEFVGVNWPPALLFLILNGAILALSHFARTQLRPLVIAYFLLANFIVVGTMWRLDLQFTRFTLYLLFFIPIFLLAWLRSRFLALAVGTLAVLVGVYGYFSSGIHPKGVPDFPMPDFGPVQGRILSVAPPSHLPSYHVHHDLIPVRTGNESILGLFIESGINGRFMGNLTRLLDSNAYVWGTPTEMIKPEALEKNYSNYARDRLRLFGISHIYTDLRLEDTLDPELAKTKRYINSYPAPRVKTLQDAAVLSKRYNMHGDLLDFYLYPIGSAALVETLPYLPKNPQSDWKLTNTIWFTQIQGVPIFTDKAVPSAVRAAQPGEWVEVVERSPNSDRLVLQVHAKQDIPVYVKIGYFPNWTLKVNGTAAQIYRASPDFMLFFGNGQAVLEYRRSWTEYAGLLISLAGLAVLVLL